MTRIRGAPKMDLWLPEAEGFFSPPKEGLGFDPAGSWEHAYVVLDNAPLRSVRKLQPEGFLRIRRTVPPDGETFALEVELLARKQRMGSFRTRVEMSCRADRLSTPLAWRIGTVSLDSGDRPVEVTRVEERGAITDGVITRNGKPVRKIDAPGAVTSNWSLFDAVQRLGGEKIEPLRFDMLEDLDLFKPNQRLSYRGTVEVEAAGMATELVGYQQIGEGILPYHYWLDGSGRLIFAYGGLRGFMFNPQAATPATERSQPRRNR